ncbi:MAG TPA: hypothetical protein ENG63_00660 [Candidatus Desulfofervidus auxilii]|uniref:Flagellar assembly protein FliH n=1 Tax=Desulfofervidus auxilii TaxID=1621989 RepID=A0A7C0U1A2_DESA2|nr:hypothetical protein [Candidatus Desulfofervidus auxilii]
MSLSNVKNFEYQDASVFEIKEDVKEITPLFSLPKEVSSEDLLVKAKEEAEQIKKQAYETGFKQGLKEGIKQGEREAKIEILKKAEEKLENLEKIIEEIAQFRQKLFQKMEKEILGLALAIAKKIVKQEVNINKEVILNNIREAINKLTEVDRVFVKVNPEDYEFIQQYRPDFLETLNQKQKIKLIKDETIKRGGCLIETDFGQIDARIEIQLENLTKDLCRA